jgi:UDP-sugar diphosphatase
MGVAQIDQIVEKCRGRFLKLLEVFYTYKGVPKRWEVCPSRDSVAVLIYHRDRGELILVRQFRLPLYLKNRDGFSYELCAGLQDKEGLTPVEVAKEEVEEECGFQVPVERFRRITSTWGSLGTSASNQIIYYVEVTDRDRVSEGGGLPEEDIELFYLKPEELVQFATDDSRYQVSPGAKFALFWWYSQIWPKIGGEGVAPAKIEKGKKGGDV